MMDKFVDEFDKFSQHKKLENLDNECKIALFSVFCKIMEQRKKVPTANKKSQKRGGHKSASEPQLDLIRKFQSRDQLSKDINLDNLTIASASELIDEGINNQQKSKKQAKQDAKAEGKIQGAYSHESAGGESEKHFWE